LRFWNWFGAVPHWVHFTALRRHALLWSWLVVAMSMLGCFSTAIGIVIVFRITVHQSLFPFIVCC
jgi:hypothetical protein